MIPHVAEVEATARVMAMTSGQRQGAHEAAATHALAGRPLLLTSNPDQDDAQDGYCCGRDKEHRVAGQTIDGGAHHRGNGNGHL